jgi:hypothetical protein
MKTIIATTFAFTIALAPVVAQAGSAELTAAKSCTVETKAMEGEFSRLSAYLNGNAVDRSFASQLIGGADAALRKSQGACEQFPDVAMLLADLGADLIGIQRSLDAAQ